MNQKRLWIAAAIIALVIVAGFALSVPHTRDVPEAAQSAEKEVVPVVALRDTYRKGVHTITGSLLAPNACTTVSANAALSGASSTQQIALTISMPSDTGICLEVPTPLTFQTTLAAPADLPFLVTVNDVVATTSAP